MSRPDDLLLAIDCGTQSVRALLFDLHGDLIAKAQVKLENYVTPQPGWMEHDVDGFWHCAARACRMLWDRYGALKAAVRGVAVTTQRGTVMPIGADGKALHPAIVWPDQRKATQLRPLSAFYRALFGALGLAATIRFFQHEAECNWLAEFRPELWRRTHKFLLVSGLINWKLTGRFVDSVGAQVGYLPLDFRRHRWAGRHDWKWQVLSLVPEQLPELHPVGTRLGEVTAEAAEATGIPAGLPVIAAAADKACELLGAGCLDPQLGGISYGTTATININSRRYLEPLPLIPPYPAAMPAHYNCEVQIQRGFWMVSWFKEQFGQPERALAEQAGLVPEALFDELVAQVPPGALGLMLQPYWTPGVRHPGPDAKGAIIGFGDVHTRAHVYRAILEGLAYALRDGRARIERKTSVPMRALRVSGGGSQSDAALQLTADIFDLPAGRPHTYETAGLGAAIDCAVGLGLFADFATAASGMTRVARTFEPSRANVALYEQLYTRVYRRMYERLAPLYAEIQRITGYPKLD
ncbi:MAG TPA: FGGY-family carbohydrate kinase [Burkholderiaceae bacterium]|nr:FGGY-family carbohydrate kinase [Burkholderiaceae bacterium]